MSPSMGAGDVPHKCILEKLISRQLEGMCGEQERVGRGGRASQPSEKEPCAGLRAGGSSLQECRSREEARRKNLETF